mgnify:CR=1 FL=1
MKTALALVATLALAAPSFAKQPKQTAGGETCGTATGIPGLGCGSGDPTINFMDTGTTTGAVNDLGSIPAACGNRRRHVHLGQRPRPHLRHLHRRLRDHEPHHHGDADRARRRLGPRDLCPRHLRDGFELPGQAGTRTAPAWRETIPAGTFYPRPARIAIYIDCAFSVPAPEAAGNYQITW